MKQSHQTIALMVANCGEEKIEVGQIQEINKRIIRIEAANRIKNIEFSGMVCMDQENSEFFAFFEEQIQKEISKYFNKKAKARNT